MSGQNFDFKNIEPKWQKLWFDNNIYQAIDNDTTREKKYILTEFPFPSGANLHVGHVFRYTVPDVYSRFLRAKGYNVMFPIGYDAFGLPTEEKARKDGKNPVVTTRENIASIRQNLQSMGYSFDWGRELATTDPEFYKWTQWIFGQMFEAGLVEQKEVELWYCPALATVLSNEEVLDDPKGSGLKVSERGEHPVEKKKMNQWVIKITDYAEQLLEGLETVNWPAHIKDMQRNWIGKSEGAKVQWEVVKPEKVFSDESKKVDFSLPIRDRSVALVRIKETGKYLVYRKNQDSQGLYRLGGGKIEEGETPEQAAVRELEEEIGIEHKYLTKVGFVGTVEKFVNYVADENMQAHNPKFYAEIVQKGGEHLTRGMEHYFLFEVSQGCSRVMAEADENGWEILEVSQDDLRQTNKWEQLDYILDKINNNDFVKENNLSLETFTTRIDTLPAVTFLAVAPEMDLVKDLQTEYFAQKVQEYQEKVAGKSERERQIGKEKTGVLTGSYARNPLNGDLSPIFVADYVLAGYGTGAVMGVAGHDERDFEFAKEMGIKIGYNIMPVGGENVLGGKAHTAEGVLFNSGKFDGLEAPSEAKKIITEYLAEKNLATKETNYKFRDWVFSRQRYWGEPFPFEYVKCDEKSDLCHSDQGGGIPSNEQINNFTFPPKPIYTTVDGQKYLVTLLDTDKLPLILPDVVDYEPSNDGRSPLAKTDWIDIKDQNGNIIGKHESDTMPNWAGSSWYYLRYIDPHNSEAFASQEKLKYWLPVDKYFGGSEHTTLHLLYSRFWHQFLYNQGQVPTMEPYQERINGGILLAEDGSKMSKSKGNVINPDDKIEKYGTDSLRLYINFIGPYDATVAWQEGGMKACAKLVETVWKLGDKVNNNSPIQRGAEGGVFSNSKKVLSALHKLIQNVEININNLKTNVAVAELMTFTNLLKTEEGIDKDIFVEFLKVLAPFAPHVAEELWYKLNNYSDTDYTKSITLASWPVFKPELVIEDEVTIVVQINGKVRGEFVVAKDTSEADLLILAEEKAGKWLEGKTVVFSKVIPNKMVTLAVK